MDRTPPSWTINAALIAGAVALVVYAEISLRNDPGQIAADFERSADELVGRLERIRDAARPSYQEEALAALPPNPSNGPFFRLDDRLTEARMSAASRWVGVATEPEIVFGFEFDDPKRPGFESGTGNSTLEVRDGLLRVVSRGPDRLASSEPLRIPRDAVGEIAIRIRCDGGTRLSLSWLGEPSDAPPAKSEVEIDLVVDGSFQTYRIDTRTSSGSGGAAGDRIARISLQPSNEIGATAEIDFIRFVSRSARYTRSPHGAGYERVGGEWRRVLYMRPMQQLGYRLRLPESAPTFDFGASVLIDGAPLAFEVTIASGDEETHLFRKTVGDARRWEDVRIDLAPWAGREVELSLRVSGSDSNIGFWSSPMVSVSPEEPMNVIVILEDGLRSDRLSTQGYWRETSPNRTELLQEGGIVFLNAFSPATKTRSSVPSLMTSLLPSATGVWSSQDRLDEAYLTWAEILRSQGFRTAAFVQNGNAGPAAGLQQGFDEVIGGEALGESTEQILGPRVRDWLSRHADRNFFLYLHILDPHGPWDPPPPFDHGFRKLPPVGPGVELDRLLDPGWMAHPTAEARQRLYEGEIRHNDSLLPDFVRTLRELGLRENTLIVLTSDHGQFLGEDGYWAHRPPGMLPAINVPLMLSYPKRFPDLRRISQAVGLLDVLPTVLELARVDRGGLLLQGDSLVDLIEGRRTSYWNDRVVVSEEPVTFHGKLWPSGSIFFRDWHLIWSRTFAVRRLAELGGQPEPGPRIFDYRDDPNETSVLDSMLRDFAARYWSIVREIQAANAAARENWIGGDRERTRLVDPATVDRLRALGYAR